MATIYDSLNVVDLARARAVDRNLMTSINRTGRLDTQQARTRRQIDWQLTLRSCIAEVHETTGTRMEVSTVDHSYVFGQTRGPLTFGGFTEGNAATVYAKIDYKDVPVPVVLRALQQLDPSAVKKVRTIHSGVFSGATDYHRYPLVSDDVEWNNAASNGASDNINSVWAWGDRDLSNSGRIVRLRDPGHGSKIDNQHLDAGNVAERRW